MDVVDVSDLMNPTLLATHQMHRPHGLSVVDNSLYICEEDQGVKVRYLVNESDTRIELLEPTSSSTPVGKFIQKKGVGIQQLAISVDDVSETISKLLEMGIKMINTVPQIGRGGNKIAFVHPSSSGGVLIELVEYV